MVIEEMPELKTLWTSFKPNNRSKEWSVDIQEWLVDILHNVFLQWILQIWQISR